MAQWVRTLAAFAEDWVCPQLSHGSSSQPSITPIFGDLMPSSGLQMYMQQSTSTLNLKQC